MELYKIKGVEIFSAGTWNGDKFTVDDLNKMVDAFNETSNGVRPFLKLGHDEGQKLLQKDGLPAAGWIERLYVQGEKLVADLCDIPEKIYKLIEGKSYRKVSSEIFYNLTVNDKKYQYLLGAVALLGADTPGVMNLNDIMAAYYKKFSNELPKTYSDNVLEFTFNNNNGKDSDMPQKTEAEIKLELELKAAKEEAQAKEDQLKKFTLDQESKDKEIETLKKQNAEFQKAQADALAEAQKAKLAQFVTELKTEKLCTPAMEGLVSELLGPEKKEYSVKIDKDEKKMSKEELLKETLKLFKAAADVNFEESSQAGDDKSKLDDDKVLNEKIEKYAEENKVSYTTAYKAIMAEKKN